MLNRENFMGPLKDQKDDVQIITNEIDDLAPLPRLTERQAECLHYLFTYFSENHYYPTQREITAQMNLKTNSAATFLDPLLKKGYITKIPSKNRNIKLTRSALLKLKLMEKKRAE
jgi:DNA-binding MarR family transcriptional regulator